MRGTVKAGKIAAMVLAGLFVVGVCIYYYYHDPAAGGAPKCVFRLISGFDCPGCGSQRALHAILHGRVAEAWSLNAFVFFAVPVGGIYLLAESFPDRFPRLHRFLLHPIAPIIVAVAIVAWWILRNIG